eukprot:m.355719 g.355719  ORF g.355719 m.355719 type:complete len:102 (-) comp20738_c0_seq35:2615-2920(-)
MLACLRDIHSLCSCPETELPQGEMDHTNRHYPSAQMGINQDDVQLQKNSEERSLPSPADLVQRFTCETRYVVPVGRTQPPTVLQQRWMLVPHAVVVVAGAA